MRKKNQKRVRLLKGEKFMYFIIILLLCLIPMLNVYTSSLVTKTNIDVEKLNDYFDERDEIFCQIFIIYNENNSDKLFKFEKVDENNVLCKFEDI